MLVGGRFGDWPGEAIAHHHTLLSLLRVSADKFNHSSSFRNLFAFIFVFLLKYVAACLSK